MLKYLKRFNILGNIINFFAFILFLIALYFLFTRGVLHFLGLLIFSLVLLTPRIIYSKINSENQIFHPETLTRVEVLVTSAIIINVLGYLWLFDKGFYYFIEYDTFVHFVAPICITLTLTILLLIYYNFKNKKVNKTKFVLNLAIITAIYTLFWEIFEYLMDIIFHVGLFGQEGQPLDTFYDVTADLLSIPVVSVIIYKYFDYLTPRFSKIKNFVKIYKDDFKRFKDKIS